MKKVVLFLTFLVLFYFATVSQSFAQVCTPGEYKNDSSICTGQCGGCEANAGEARILQCRQDGSDFDEKGSECQTICAGPCTSTTPNPTTQPTPIPPTPSADACPTYLGTDPTTPTELNEITLKFDISATLNNSYSIRVDNDNNKIFSLIDRSTVVIGKYNVGNHTFRLTRQTTLSGCSIDDQFSVAQSDPNAPTPTPIPPTCGSYNKYITVSSPAECVVSNCPASYQCNAKLAYTVGSVDCICYASANFYPTPILTPTPIPTPTPLPFPPPCLEGFDENHNKITIDQNADQKTRQEQGLKIVECTKVDSAVGGIDTAPEKFISRLYVIILSMAGGWAVFLIITGGYKLMFSQGNPEAVQEAREKITSAIVGLLFIILSLVILQIIGVDIFQIPGFEK